MEYSREQLIAGVRKAAAAGDYKAANELAEVLDGMDTPEPTPEPAPVEGPGFLERAGDTLGQAYEGVKDAFTGTDENFDTSNIDPATMEAFGTPTYSPAEQVQSAASRGLRGAGTVVADAAISAGKEVLPEGVQQAVGQGVEAVANSAPAQALGAASDALKEASPEAHRRLGEVADIALMGKTPTYKGYLNRKGAELKKSQKKVPGNRKTKVQDMLEPEDGYGKGSSDVDILGNARYGPSDIELQEIEAVAGVPKVRINRSARYNHGVVSKEATKRIEDINKAIDKAGNPEMDIPILLDRIGSAVDDLAKSPEGFAVTGNVQAAANKMTEQARRMLEKTDGSANAVLQVRRDFDKWVDRGNKGAYNPDTESAVSIAKEVVRNTLNQAVDQAVPSVKLLPKQQNVSALIRASDTLAKKGAKEAKSTVGRIWQKLSNMGALPSTGLALGATGAYYTGALGNPLIQALAAIAGTGYLGTKAVQYGSREWRQALGTIAKGADKLLKAGVITKADKLALIGLMEDEYDQEPINEDEQMEVGTVTPPTVYNVFGDKKNAPDTAGAAQRKAHMAGLEKQYGAPERGLGQMRGQMAEAITNYNPQVQARHVGAAAGNAGQLGLLGGLLTNPNEEQQK